MTKASPAPSSIKVEDSIDKEVQALRDIAGALNSIQPDSRRRVLTFMKGKFSADWPSSGDY